MKTKFHHSFIALTLLALSSLNLQLSTAFAQGTAFTYQGQLQNGGSPVAGSYDLVFTLYLVNSGGTAMAGPVTNTATAVTNGLFTTQVDFGPNVFTGSSKWLEIAISTNGANSFTTLAPRQQLTPAPYAITAESFSGILTPSELPSFQPPYATIGGGTANVAADSYSTVSGGTENSISTINGSYSAIGGGYGNSINYVITSVSPFSYTSSSLCTIGGGDENTINGSYASTIGGGDGNTVNGDYSTVGGGGINSANAAYATVSGGSQNIASGEYSTVGGGYFNRASGYKSTVPGGGGNFATGDFSFAAGAEATAGYEGSFVWSDSTSVVSDSKPNQFLIFSAGGVGIGTSQSPPGGLRVATGGLAVTGASSPNYGNTAVGVFIEKTATAGAVYAFNYGTSSPIPLLLNSPGGNVGIGTTTPGALLQVGNATCNGTSWVNASDRNAKQDFAAINPRTVLEKVSGLPITEWKYKVEPDGTEHLGPMAQDFHAAFGLNGADDKHISTVDEGGVALAAIQGLNQKVEEKDARIQEQESRIQNQTAEITELKARLEVLEKIVLNQKPN